ncbi:MAG: trigger factor [Oscillospiraceae bacterium]|nr:trigger factor [Oscillospiraceae bacterium]
MSFTYKGLSAQLNRHIVTDEEITRQLQRLAEQNPRIAKITDRPTELGDEVVLDYAGFVGGEQFAGGTAENQTLVLGSGMFIPGFEEQLLDKVVEEKVTVKVIFPTEYHSADLAGKEAEFKCVIHEIRVKTPYQLDDVFAKEVGQCDTLDEMREKLGQSMQAYSDERAEMDLQDRLLRLSSATLEVAFTDEQIEAAVDQQLKVLEAQLSRQGLSLDMYCSFMNTTADDLRRDARPTAEATLLNQAAIDMIIELESLQAEESEIAEALAVICRQNNMTMEQMQAYYDAEFEKAVIKSVLTSKALRLIRDAADIAVADK